MRTVSSQLRDIDQNFSKHMPKRQATTIGPKVTYNHTPFNEEEYRRTNQNLATWAAQRQPVFNQELTDHYGTPAFSVPN